MKEIKRIFQPQNVDTLKFIIRKVNAKHYNQMSQADLYDAFSFLQDCESDIREFMDEISVKIKERIDDDDKDDEEVLGNHINMQQMNYIKSQHKPFSA